MISHNKNKTFLIVLLLVLFFSVSNIYKGTYSDVVLDDVIVFDYSLEVDKQDKIIKYINNDTKNSEIINKISVEGDYSLDILVTNSTGVEKDKTSIVATGDLLVINVSDKSDKYKIAVRGDANGDGKVNLVDLVQLRKHIVNWRNPETGKIENKTGVNLSAIDMNGDGKITLVDLVRVRKIIVEIEEEIFLIKTNLNNLGLKVGDSKEIKYYVYPSNVSNKNVKWTSSDTNVATVSSKGVVTAVGEGEAVITVTTNNLGKTASTRVVVEKIESPMLNKVIEIDIDDFRDPAVLIDNGIYYLYGTWGIAYKNNTGSLDGEWEYLGQILNKPNDYDGDLWAPEVYKYNDSYYMFITYKSSVTKHRGTSVFKADSPEGPFVEFSDGHVTPKDWDSIDGTLYIDDTGQPWMFFVHEWTSTSDGIGRMAVAKLSSDLTQLISEPIELFKATDASWVGYTITDGCWMYKTKDGQLLMLWSNLDKSKNYAVGIARSKSGSVVGPWTHDSELLYSKTLSGKYDGGHGMIFTDINGQMYLSIHTPNTETSDRKERPTFVPIYEINGTLKIVK